MRLFNNIHEMDINELKKLIQNSTSVLVLDNGEPLFVILGYKTYKDMTVEKAGEREIKINQGGNGSGSHFIHERETEILENLNKEILALKAQIEMEEKGLTNPHSEGID